MRRRALQAVDDNLQGSSATGARIISLVNHQGSDFFGFLLATTGGITKNLLVLRQMLKMPNFKQIMRLPSARILAHDVG